MPSLKLPSIVLPEGFSRVEKTLSGEGTREWVVRSSTEQKRDWLKDAPICQSLQRYGIVHVGIAVAVDPYCVVRTDLSGTFLMMCASGIGEVFIDGVWKEMKEGMACLAPPHVFHAYRAIPGQSWEISWVRYQEPKGTIPMVSTSNPIMESFDSMTFHLAIRGLAHEACGSKDPVAMHLWVDLIESYSQSFVKPWRSENRLRDLWKTVNAKLDTPWTIESMSDLAALSPRQFRRIQQHSSGMTPKEFLISLRMQRAITLLITTDLKVESIARAVGYQSVYTFSSKFNSFTGFSPTDYRKSSINTSKINSTI